MWAIRLEDRKQHDGQKDKRINAGNVKGKEDEEKHTMKVLGKLRRYLKKKTNKKQIDPRNIQR